MTSNMNDPYLMAWEDSADRVPVLWIHGYPLAGTLWDLQVDDLADIARSIVPDLRGFGASEPTPPPVTLADYADDCAHLLDTLGWEGPVVVAGLSMGGYIALEFARRHPERVAGLLLAATRAGADGDAAKAKRDAAAETARKEGAGAIADAMLPKLLAPGRVEADPELAGFVRDMMADASVDGIVGALTAMRDRDDATDRLAGLDVPALVIHGADDQLIPVDEARATAEALPDAELVLLDGAGHLPCLEVPEAFNDAVRPWLEGFYGEDVDAD